jgi:hypothetical protein
VADTDRTRVTQGNITPSIPYTVIAAAAHSIAFAFLLAAALLNMATANAGNLVLIVNPARGIDQLTRSQSQRDCIRVSVRPPMRNGAPANRPGLLQKDQ